MAAKPVTLITGAASRELEPSIVVNNAGSGLRGEAGTLDRARPSSTPGPVLTIGNCRGD
jgi:hypothetical protein